MPTPIESEIKRLKDKGYWFWTEEICSVSTIGENNLLRDLKDSREAFIQLLVNSSEFTLLDNLIKCQPPLTKALAVKHAMIATDAGAEILDRTKSFIADKKIRVLNAVINGQVIPYTIRKLGVSFRNKLDNEGILHANDDLLTDLFFVISFGSVIKEFGQYLTFKRFKIAEICGQREAVSKYFQERYLDVSRQLTQLEAQGRGDFLNGYVSDFLQEQFVGNNAIRLVDNRRVPGLGDSIAESLGGGQFDSVFAVHTKQGQEKYVAIEIAFQETTNSTMERKARLASATFGKFNQLGHKLCFIVDGAGYLSGRPKALKEIIEHSHFRCTLKKEEMLELAEFIKSLST